MAKTAPISNITEEEIARLQIYEWPHAPGYVFVEDGVHLYESLTHYFRETHDLPHSFALRTPRLLQDQEFDSMLLFFKKEDFIAALAKKGRQPRNPAISPEASLSEQMENALGYTIHTLSHAPDFFTEIRIPRKGRGIEEELSIDCREQAAARLEDCLAALTKKDGVRLLEAKRLAAYPAPEQSAFRV